MSHPASSAPFDASVNPRNVQKPRALISDCAFYVTMLRMENEQNTQTEDMPALDIVLASASPRRKQLLEDAGVRFVVHASEVDETLEPDLLADPPEACKKLAERKAGAVVQEVLAEDYTGMAAVIGADTMVVCEGEIFGKPVSLSDAKRMLRRLYGGCARAREDIAWLPNVC